MLVWAGALIVAFMGAEVAAGLFAHSLALLSDAAHMLTDAASIALALITMKLAARPARGGYTYGLRRMEILSAQANGITLVLLAILLCYEAVRRLITPHPVTGGLMLGVALAGVLVNLAAAWLRRGGFSWRPRPPGSTRRPSAPPWSRAPTWSKSTTCISGRSLLACRPRPRTSWSPATRIATPSGSA
jgi:cation diffusion facilitator family transporter